MSGGALVALGSAGCSLAGGGQDVAIGTDSKAASCAASEPFWSFEEGSGPRTRDRSGAGNDMSLVDRAAFSTDVPATLAASSRYSLELFPDGYLLADDDLATWLAADASVSYWMKLKSLPPAPDPGRRILCGFKWLVSWGTVQADGSSALLTKGDTESTGPSKLDVGTWHHIAQSRDSTSGELRVYVDGQLGAPRPGLTGRASDAFREVGRNYPEVADGLDAYIDDLRLFARVLTADEVAALALGRGPSGVETCTP